MPGAVERRALVKERTAIHGEFSVRRQARLKEMLIDLDAIRAAGLKLRVDPLGGAARPY
jgi:phosphoglucomutase